MNVCCYWMKLLDCVSNWVHVYACVFLWFDRTLCLSSVDSALQRRSRYPQRRATIANWFTSRGKILNSRTSSLKSQQFQCGFRFLFNIHFLSTSINVAILSGFLDLSRQSFSWLHSSAWEITLSLLDVNCFCYFTMKFFNSLFPVQFCNFFFLQKCYITVWYRLYVTL